jgi:hypothetical protein
MASVKESTPFRVIKAAKTEAILAFASTPQQCMIVALKFISIITIALGNVTCTSANASKISDLTAYLPIHLRSLNKLTIYITKIPLLSLIIVSTYELQIYEPFPVLIIIRLVIMYLLVICYYFTRWK